VKIWNAQHKSSTKVFDFFVSEKKTNSWWGSSEESCVSSWFGSSEELERSAQEQHNGFYFFGVI